MPHTHVHVQYSPGFSITKVQAQEGVVTQNYPGHSLGGWKLPLAMQQHSYRLSGIAHGYNYKQIEKSLKPTCQHHP